MACSIHLIGGLTRNFNSGPEPGRVLSASYELLRPLCPIDINEVGGCSAPHRVRPISNRPTVPQPSTRRAGHSKSGFGAEKSPVEQPVSEPFRWAASPFSVLSLTGPGRSGSELQGDPCSLLCLQTRSMALHKSSSCEILL